MGDKVKPRHENKSKRGNEQYNEFIPKSFGTKIKKEKRSNKDSWKKNYEQD